MIYRVSHLTEYRYADAVATSHHELHLLPRAVSHQSVQWEDLSVDPHPARRSDRVDYFGNRATHLEIAQPHHRLAVLSRSEIEVFRRQSPLPTIAPAWEVVRDQVHAARGYGEQEAVEFWLPSPYAEPMPGVRDYAIGSFTPGRPFVEALLDLMHRIHREFTYDPAATNVSTPVDEVLAHRRGVCQDFAHLAISCLRSLELPARYVSGYLVTGNAGGPQMVGADASHAWVQAYCPGVGWIDFDPTNDVIPGDRHVTIAYGRDFGDVTPLRGVIMGGGHHELGVAVSVVPVPAEASEA